MNKKQQKHYRKLLVEKLESLGVKDQTSLKPTGFNSFALFIEKDQVANTEAKKVQKAVKTMQLQNLQKHIIKTLLSAGEEAVERFLKSEIEVKNPSENKNEDVQVSSAN